MKSCGFRDKIVDKMLLSMKSCRFRDKIVDKMLLSMKAYRFRDKIVATNVTRKIVDTVYGTAMETKNEIKKLEFGAIERSVRPEKGDKNEIKS